MKWRDLLTIELTDTANINGADIQIINPATYFDFDNMDRHLEKEAMQFDLNIVRQSDIVIANVDGISDSIGTAIEVYEANWLNIPVIAYTYSGVVNDTIHPWIQECLSTVQMTTYELIDYVRDYYMVRYIK